MGTNIKTPKEKAKELVEKYHKYDLLFWDLTWIQAKLCALIAVDEILNNDNNFFNTYSKNDYWIDVKQEINKL